MCYSPALGGRVVAQQSSERIGAALRRAIDSQLEARGKPGSPLSIGQLRQNRRLRGEVFIAAGQAVWKLGSQKEGERLKKVGGSVADTGWRALIVSGRNP